MRQASYSIPRSLEREMHNLALKLAKSPYAQRVKRREGEHIIDYGRRIQRTIFLDAFALAAHVSGCENLAALAQAPLSLAVPNIAKFPPASAHESGNGFEIAPGPNDYAGVDPGNHSTDTVTSKDETRSEVGFTTNNHHTGDRYVVMADLRTLPPDPNHTSCVEVRYLMWLGAEDTEMEAMNRRDLCRANKYEGARFFVMKETEYQKMAGLDAI